jgi:hypothetical protein
MQFINSVIRATSLLLIILAHVTYPYCIVYVHLGNTLPIYWYDSVKQSRLFNKSCPIYLIANKSALNKRHPLSYKFSENSVTLVEIESLTKSKKHEEFINITALDKKWRDGFWFYASERFFVLDDFAQQFGVTDIIHLENDNMVYVDFTHLMPLFKKYYPGIGGIFASDERCIPGLIYFADKKITHELISLFNKLACKGIDDMHTIGRFYHEKSYDGAINMLPVIMPEYISSYGLKTATGKIPVKPYQYSSHIEEFNSIFDGAAIGIYMGGYDPRNNKLGPGSIHPHTVFNASLLKFEWHTDREERKIPFAIFAGKAYRINNIHVHCKNLKPFASKAY